MNTKLFLPIYLLLYGTRHRVAIVICSFHNFALLVLSGVPVFSYSAGLPIFPGEVRSRPDAVGEGPSISQCELDRLRGIQFESWVDESGCGKHITIQGDFMIEQRGCSSLQYYWKLAESGASKELIIDNGLLYRIAPPNCRSVHDKLLIVPVKFRKQILFGIHDRGTVGTSRCRKKALSVLFWTRMSKHIADYERSCCYCQRIRPIRKADRAGLNPIPILDRPAFEEVAIDVLGPTLPVTRGGRNIVY